MRCSKCQKLSDEATRGLLPERLGRKVRKHIESCPACSVYYQENEALRSLLLETASPPVTPGEDYFRGLARRVVAQADADRPLDAASTGLGAFDLFKGRWRAAGLVRAAAVLAIGMIAGFGLARLHFAGAGEQTVPVRMAEKPMPPGMEIAQSFPLPSVPISTPATIQTPAPSQVTPPPVQPSRSITANPSSDLPEPFPSHGPVKKIPSYENENRPVEVTMVEGQRNHLPGVDPQLLLTTAQKAMSLLENLPPSEEYENLRRIGQMSRRVKAATILTSLQNLKLQLVRNGQTNYIPVVHQIEGLVNEMALATPESRAAHFAYLDTYQQAEMALINKDYDKAMRFFRQVVIEAPNSYFAALAKYEIGNINYEYYHDYGNAVLDYSQCLEESKPEFLSQEIQNQIHERVRLITQNKMDNYAPLRLFDQAQAARDRQRALNFYSRLIQKYPQSTLVQPAIEAVTRIVRQTPNNENLSNRMVMILDQFLQQNPEHPLRLHVQLAIADISHYPLRDRAQARIDYGRILQEAKDPELIEVLQTRLGQLDDER